MNTPEQPIKSAIELMREHVQLQADMRAAVIKAYWAMCEDMRAVRPAVISYQIGFLIRDIPGKFDSDWTDPRMREMVPRLPEIYESDGVYVGRDGAGGVLYVGYSHSFQHRIHEHVRRVSQKSEYGEMVRANMPASLKWAVDFYPTIDRKAGLALEKQLIRQLKPTLNQKQMKYRH